MVSEELNVRSSGATKRTCAAAQSIARPIGVFILAVLVFAVAAQCKKTPPSAPVDLNTATVAELVQIPGIGPETARSIVQFREKSGPFKRVEDLLAIRGITPRKLKQIKPYATIAAANPARPAKS
jgi:competence protein ComEA